MKSIEYYGEKEEAGPCTVNVKVVFDDGRVQVSLLKHIVRHSPDGFQMGYSGSGCADLALSILTDYFLKNNMDINTNAIQKYHIFKEDFVAPAKKELRVTGEGIKEWLSMNRR
jgi:hypothetical protein